MKLTKYTHACVVLEQDNQLLIIDPGIFTTLPEDILGVVAIVITHIHPDHFSKAHIEKIVSINPEAKIFTTSEVAELLEDTPNVIEVLDEDEETIGAFTLKFSGDAHATIHSAIPVAENISVLINKSVFYPGDSFTIPETVVHTLLVPASAPWMKISEAMDYITSVSPQTVIPTHDAILSENGKKIHDMWLAKASEQVASTFMRLENGASISSSV